MSSSHRRLFTLSLLLGLCAPSVAQEPRPPVPGSDSDVVADRYTLTVTPSELVLEVGDKRKLEAVLTGPDGEPAPYDVFFFSRRRRSVSVDREGNLEALQPGTFEIIARTERIEDKRLSTKIKVTIAAPPLDHIALQEAPTLWTGTTRALEAHAVDRSGTARGEVAVRYESSDPSVATVDTHGHLRGRTPGEAQITLRAEELVHTFTTRVESNPVAVLLLDVPTASVRTGDVVQARAICRDTSGQPVPEAPVSFSFRAAPTDDLGPAATGQIAADGRFVAEQPGLYTLVARCGSAVGEITLRVDPRRVERKVELLGHGEVLDVHTSDLWVWEGKDGRDYAVTGTWGANGEAYFWDVTDPSDLKRISVVQVDARTVNDVKVSQDGTLCVISREGASNRKNGIVLIDVTDPSTPTILSEYHEHLTGGVHNLFIDGDYVYALSAARRYDIIDIRDRTAPRRVSSFELDTPGHSIHDVWVADGLAYSSNWQDGVHIVDVGNGIAGGSPENPVHVSSYAYPSGWNHAAFPYRSEDTGKFYVVAGDEAFPYGLSIEERPTYPRGWLHFIDFSDMENPREVARYEVPEAGTHNLWIEDDLLYVAYYNGGLRVVDISGDLMGDLYRQGREVAWYLPTHHEGVVPNAPMTWGPQPHKGNIFFSDWNSGLWAVRLEKEANQ